ncbi:MAG: hypothetical protein M0C28_34805 [Candidatus Moduliflexus flocculans]|nr:hypothetical protein [Candidatus Moduliflexus flocculans]
MNEYTGWILDIYSHPERGIVLWLICDDGQRRCLFQDFPVTFYAAGPSHRLRDLWKFLEKQPLYIKIARTERRDLFTGGTVVLAATLDSPAALPPLLQTLTKLFPDLTFYDADLHVELRHAAVYGTFPLARCHVTVDDENVIRKFDVLDSAGTLTPNLHRYGFSLEPDVDPFHRRPKKILARSQKNNMTYRPRQGKILVGLSSLPAQTRRPRSDRYIPRRYLAPAFTLETPVRSRGTVTLQP